MARWSCRAGTATTSTSYDSRPLDLFASVYNSSVGEAVPQHFRWLAEPVSNDTSTASGRIDLLYGSGTNTPAETGFSINSKGIATFGFGQTFPGAGTITGVTAGTDLTGGGTTGKVTLNVDTSKVPQLNTTNSFTGNQYITGFIQATGTISANNLEASGSVYGSGGSFQGGGVTASAPSFGLYGYETGNLQGLYGVGGLAEGNSAQTFGVYGVTASTAGDGVYGVLLDPSSEGSNLGLPPAAGVWGDTNVDQGTGVLGTSDTGSGGSFYSAGQLATVRVENDYSSNGTYGALLLAEGGGGGYCLIDGSADLECTGSKSAVVPVDNGNRNVALYAVEAPENWFEDFGSGQLSNGVATIKLELTFAQTVNTGVEYHVFLTPKGDSRGLYVSNETPSGFEVHESAGGRSNIAFDYRIVARRKGYEAIRLADKTKEIQAMRRPRRNANDVTKPAAAKPATVVAVHQ